MKKFLFISICLSLILFVINAQQDEKKDKDSVMTANSQITEVRLSGFEDASFWETSMSLDQGVVMRQTVKGAPNDLVNDQAVYAIKKRDEKYGIPAYPKEKVLGVKVQFIARGYNWFSIKPVKPIVIEGICQSLSVYVAGRNYKHLLKMLVLDYFGKEMEIVVDKLNFVGWKELVVPIPERILQSEYHYVYKQGLKFNGFVIECDPMEAYGVFYIYFDELRAMTDIFNEKIKDVDDMQDNW